MSHILDNAVWNAITTGNRDIAKVKGNVGCYFDDVAPFAGMKEMNEANLDTLYNFIGPKKRIALSYLDEISLDESKWKPLMQMYVSQMVYTNPVSDFVTDKTNLIVPLGEKDVPQMLELTALTKPGPFREKTILFRNYFGIFDNNKLVAMTGQRMHPLTYMEVSAVCTHPNYRGHGYAAALMLHVMKIILDNSFTPFLHVLHDNTRAIKIYESLGFTIRRNLHIDILKRM